MEKVEGGVDHEKSRDDSSKLLSILEEVANDINIIRNDCEYKIKMLEDAIHKVHQKLETMVKVSQTTIQDSA